MTRRRARGPCRALLARPGGLDRPRAADRFCARAVHLDVAHIAEGSAGTLRDAAAVSAGASHLRELYRETHLWTKGTFLTPQHLQVQDRFLEDTLNFRLQALKFCPWGFRDLAINSELLAEGQFAVTRASGIFPDGLLFEIPEADPPPPSKTLDEFFDPGTKNLDIYLAVPTIASAGSMSPARRRAVPVTWQKLRLSAMRTPGQAKSRFRSRGKNHAPACRFGEPRRLVRAEDR